MVSAFLDTNIILNWLSVARLTDKQRMKYKRDIANKYVSYEMIEKIISEKGERGKFYASRVSLAEMIKLISEKLCWNRMYKDGIPSHEFFYYYRKMKITRKEVGEMIDGAAVFDSLIEDGILRTDELKKDGKMSESLLMVYLIGELKIEIHDAILICEAVHSKCQYFITGDGRLLDNKVKIKEIEIMQPQKFLEILKCEKYESLRH
ncbi:MAG: hypothetical protein WC492_03380 [Candidatus Micrarchaeia archaeon]